ncbi:MAG: PAS domain S-box protein, partial [Bdellovibrionaceae bacterium]|nr:PAS domain S-box protein [Pseudobdellovibrionaceae bacterium]
MLCVISDQTVRDWLQCLLDMVSADIALLLKELQDQKYALDQAAIVAATDRRGIITYVNDKFCEISGYQREELLGQTHRIINSGYHDANFFKDLWQTIASGRVWRGEIKNRAKDGRYYWVATTIVPFVNERQQVYQYLSIRQDITELKKAQETILQQQAQLVTASKLSALGELAAVLTHEINNPLSVVLGRVEMLLNLLQNKDAVSKQKLIEMLESIQVTAQRIEKIMKTVQALAHQSDSEYPEKVTVRSVIESVLDIFGPRLKRHQVAVRVDIPDDQWSLETRPTEVFQILSNLLSNAIDAVRELPEDRWVAIRVSRKDRGFQFCVEDSGPGVGSHIVNRLFTPFFTTKGVGVGTGLGLTISQSLAHKNKGLIT